MSNKIININKKRPIMKNLKLTAIIIACMIAIAALCTWQVQSAQNRAIFSFNFLYYRVCASVLFKNRYKRIGRNNITMALGFEANLNWSEGRNIKGQV